MDFTNLSSIETPYGSCYRITDDNGNNIWWCPVNIQYYRQTNIIEKIGDETIYYGQDGNRPDQPYKIGDWYRNQWSSPCKSVTEDLIAILTYSNSYRVTFKQDTDGSQISTELLPAGSSVAYPDPPSIENYTFDRWSPEQITDLSSDSTVTAKYLKNEILVDSVCGAYKYDQNYHSFLMTAHLNNDSGSPTIYYSHDEQSWTTEPYKRKDLNTTLTVYYKIVYDNYPVKTDYGTLRIEDAEIFDVTFKYKQTNGEETQLTEKVPYGQSATAPQIPEPVAYEFTNWDKSFSQIYSNTEISAVYTRRTITCNVYSSLSTSHVTNSLYYGDSLNPNSVCDQEPKDRYVFQKWYAYKNNNAIDVNESELLEFTQNGLSIYPLYRRIQHVNTYILSSSEAEHFRTYPVLSGSNLGTESIEIPDIPGCSFQRIDPSEWNPVNSDTDLSIVYSSVQNLIDSNNEYVIDSDGNLIEVV